MGKVYSLNGITGYKPKGPPAGAILSIANDTGQGNAHVLSGMEKGVSPPLSGENEPDLPICRPVRHNIPTDTDGHISVRTVMAEEEARQGARSRPLLGDGPRRRVTLAAPLLSQEGDTIGVEFPSHGVTRRLLGGDLISLWHVA